MDPLKGTGFVLKVMSTIGVGEIIHGAVKQTTLYTGSHVWPAAWKACTAVAEIGIAGIVTDKVNDYVDKTMDELADIIAAYEVRKEHK